MRYLAHVARNNARIQYAVTRVRVGAIAPEALASIFPVSTQFTHNLAGSQTDTGRDHCQRDR